MKDRQAKRSTKPAQQSVAKPARHPLDPGVLALLREAADILRPPAE